MEQNVWVNTCRLCLEIKTEFVDTEASEEVANFVSTVLLEIFQISMVPGEDLPQEVCCDCLDKMNTVWEFRSQVLENQKILQQHTSCETMVFEVSGKEMTDDEELLIESVIEDTTKVKEEFAQICEEATADDIILEEPSADDIIVEEPWEEIDETYQGDVVEEPEVKEKRAKRQKNPDADKVILEKFPDFERVTCPWAGMSWAQKDEYVREYVTLDCKECKNGEIFSSFEDLLDHYRSAKHTTQPYVICCNKNYFKRDLLNAHMVTHTHPEAFACFVCKRRMKSKDYLKKHLFTHLPYELRPIKCEHCDKKFLANNQLRVHMASHLPPSEKKYGRRKKTTGMYSEDTGEIMGEVEIKTEEIDRKLRHHDQDRAILERYPDFEYIQGQSVHIPMADRDEVMRQFVSLECKECVDRPTFETFEKLEDHYVAEQHTTKPFVTCCGKDFYRKPYLFNHVAIHVNPTAFACPECDHLSKSKDLLKKHLYTHLPKDVRPLECAQCGKRYVTKAQLRFHLANHVRVEDRPFDCNECGKSFAYRFVLERHKKAHNRVPDYVCEVCAKTFIGRSNYLDHKMRHHDIPDPVTCPICGNKYKNHVSLRSHMELHTDQREHKCTQCMKIFTARAGLLAHIRYVHSGQWRYKCSACPKAFRTKREHRDHMLRHTDRSIYQCKFCSKTFSTSSYYYSHRKKAHPVEHAKLPKKQKFFVEK
ncbi:zinc finger protein 184-like [Phlebotomus papatasi]|uniref:zinc finger protein 184-like n=1 Tax=Phlebotomus papatasi TaxID=29031 RepID=UPI002483DD81|nr:zinc finger protein 184-like [Phlebotomus papatasi]